MLYIMSRQGFLESRFEYFERENSILLRSKRGTNLFIRYT